MKRLARIALKLVTGAGTVFIAACYGPPYPARLIVGAVRDAGTRVPIPGIAVSCLDGAAVLQQERTDEQGQFHMVNECPEYRAEDVDGASNGSYAPKTVPYDGSGSVAIDLDPIP
jgi:hypothetical protein